MGFPIYDGHGNVILTIRRDVSGTKTTLVDGYDSVGNRASRNQNGTTYDWTYDAANRLVSQTSSASARATFVYDAEGNTLVKHHQGSSPLTMTYDPASRLVTAVQGAVVSTFTSDANGNQTLENAGGTLTTNVYDKENRLWTTTSKAGEVSTSTYDGDGLRRSLALPDKTVTTFVWDGTDYLGEATA